MVSCRGVNIRSKRWNSPPRSRASTNSTAITPNPISSSSLTPRLVACSEKNSESRITAPKSAMDAAAMISCPVRPVACPESLSTGTTSPSEVAHRMIATSSGDEVKPAADSASPASTASANDATKPSSASVSGRPRSRRMSISRPARNSRNASPINASTSTGGSTCTHPSSAGPITIPATISNTGDGTRTRGISRTTSGARNATTMTISRFVNDMDAS